MLGDATPAAQASVAVTAVMAASSAFWLPAVSRSSTRQPDAAADLTTCPWPDAVPVPTGAVLLGTGPARRAAAVPPAARPDPADRVAPDAVLASAVTAGMVVTISASVT